MRRPAGRPHRVPPSQIESAASRHAAGESWARVARDFRVSREALRSAVRRIESGGKQGVVENRSEEPEITGGSDHHITESARQHGQVPRATKVSSSIPLDSVIPTTLGPTDVRPDGSLWDRAGRCLYRPGPGIGILADPGYSSEYPAPVVVYTDRTIVRRLTGEIVGFLAPDVGPDGPRHLDLATGRVEDPEEERRS